MVSADQKIIKQPISISIVHVAKNDNEEIEKYVEHQHTPIKVYKFRYFILMTEFLLNVTNQVMFSSYAPIANYTDQYYGQSTTDRLSIIYMGISVPSMVIAIGIAQKLGFRKLLVLCAFLNAVGGVIRLTSNIDGLSDEARLTLVLLGQSFAALANPGTLFLNTKIAATWFPISQRASTTAILSVSAPLGMLAISATSTAVVQSSSDMIWLNIIVCIPCVLTFFMTLAIRSDAPKTPPSHTAVHPSIGTWDGLRTCLTNRNYIILVCCLGAELGIFNTFYTMIQQILCTRGYGSKFSTLTFILLIGGGVIGSTIAGVILDRIKKFVECVKLCLCISALASICVAEFAILPNMNTEVAVSMLVYGTFGLSFYSMAMETSAEITYPVEETTSSGMIGLLGQLSGAIFTTIWNQLTTVLPDRFRNMETCSVSGQTADETNSTISDMTLPLFIFHTFGTTVAVILVVFFKPRYVRLEQEMKEAEKEEEQMAKQTNEIIKMKF